MKKIVYLLLLITSMCYAKNYKMDCLLTEGMNHYFVTLIPKYYKGQKDFTKDMQTMPFGVHMQGNGFSEIKGTNDLLFNFYFLIGHDRQDIQVIRFMKNSINGKIYEYWVVKMSDIGAPYRYSYFYLTETESITSPRKILDVDKYYKDKIIVNENIEIDLSVPNLITLYQAKPWIRSESYKNTRYDRLIVCWKNETPFLRKMNLIEKIYYNNIRKSDR